MNDSSNASALLVVRKRMPGKYSRALKNIIVNLVHPSACRAVLSAHMMEFNFLFLPLLSRKTSDSSSNKTQIQLDARLKSVSRFFSTS